MAGDEGKAQGDRDGGGTERLEGWKGGKGRRGHPLFLHDLTPLVIRVSYFVARVASRPQRLSVVSAAVDSHVAGRVEVDVVYQWLKTFDTDETVPVPGHLVAVSRTHRQVSTINALSTLQTETHRFTVVLYTQSLYSVSYTHLTLPTILRV